MVTNAVSMSAIATGPARGHVPVAMVRKRQTDPDPAPALPGNPYFIAASQVTMPPGWHLDRHFHDDSAQMLILTGGEMAAIVGDEQVTAREGDVLHYPLGIAHEERNTGTHPIKGIYLGFRIDGAKPSDAARYKSHDIAGRILYLARWLLERAPVSTATDRAFADTLIAAILLEHSSPTEAHSRNLLSEVRTYVRKHLSASITLDDLACATHLSRYRFAHAFKEATGQTPARFVQQIRVEEAYARIVTSHLPLKAIAQETGFADEFHLSKSFRRLLGRTPSSLRSGSKPGKPAC